MGFKKRTLGVWQKGTREMNEPYNDYIMSQAEVAEKLFLHKNTVLEIEKRALNKMRKMLEERGISANDLLPD